MSSIGLRRKQCFRNSWLAAPATNIDNTEPESVLASITKDYLARQVWTVYDPIVHRERTLICYIEVSAREDPLDVVEHAHACFRAAIELVGMVPASGAGVELLVSAPKFLRLENSSTVTANIRAWIFEQSSTDADE